MEILRQQLKEVTEQLECKEKEASLARVELNKAVKQAEAQVEKIKMLEKKNTELRNKVE